MRAGPALLSLLLAAGAAAAQAEPDRLTAGGARHAVTIRVEPQPGEAVAAGRDLRVTIAYREPGTDRPVPALRPRAWIRRSGAGPGCADAAWMVRASGAISPADLPLERDFLLALSASAEGDEDRVAVIDQGHRLRSADHVSVTALGARAGGLALHPSRPRLLATRPGRGDVVAVALPWGGLVPVASGLRRPGPLAPLGDGLAVVEEEGGLVLLGPDGLRRAEVPLGPPPRRLLAPDAGGLAVTAADGSALVVRRDGARTVLPPGTLGALAEAGPGLLVEAGAEAALRLRWLDDPTRAIPVALPFVPGGLAVHGAGRFALAWDRDGTRAVPADPAAAPALRRVRLPGPAGSAPGLAGGADRPSAALLVPGSGTVALVAAGGGLPDQPAATVTVRGDRPHAVAWFDQRLAEEEPGTFATTVRLVAGGRYEVVTTTGPGGTTACAGFAVAGPAPPEEAAAALAVVSAPARAGEAGLLRLRVENRPGWLRGGAVGLRIQDLELGAAARIRAELGEDAVVTAAVTFPEPGTYAVSVEAGAGAIAPAVIGVAP
ncbi:hypothetical protein [Methylobacterium oryzihabitans]|uniref:Uncharacterized protein n=1 Tax=Methylobacterium oryzihabitans TaxID=2499852 RepID=A0A3S2W3Z2_9HYPH|nr:hypothetical protein [Methylobacterium oryzihabitans]RVU13096.1 hypothetical protein EOE48_27200 [Methylobacterium oryzihabitans]